MAYSHNEKGQDNVMIIPDYKISVVISFLEMIYTGSTLLGSDNDFEDMKQFGFKLLGFFMGLNMNVKLAKTSNGTPKSVKVVPTTEIIQMNHRSLLNQGQNETLTKHDYFTSTLSENPSKRSKPKPSITSSNNGLLHGIDICGLTNKNNDDSGLSEEEPDFQALNTKEFFRNSYTETRMGDIDMAIDSGREWEEIVVLINTNEHEQSNTNEPKVSNDCEQEVSEQKVSKKILTQRGWECKSCFEKFRTGNELLQHSLDLHNETHHLVCSLCPKRFTTKGHLNTHYKVIHLNERDVICDKCGKKFPYKSELRKHLKNMRSCTNQILKMYQCQYCKAKSTTKEGLKTHFKRIHSKSC